MNSWQVYNKKLYGNLVLLLAQAFESDPPLIVRAKPDISRTGFEYNYLSSLSAIGWLVDCGGGYRLTEIGYHMLTPQIRAMRDLRQRGLRRSLNRKLQKQRQS